MSKEEAKELINVRVEIVGTSRDDLNGQIGVVTTFDEAKGRYGVKLDSGKSVSFKPANIQPVEEEAKADEPPKELHSIEQVNGFRCQPPQMFQALTDAKMLTGYTQAPCNSDVKVGGKFSHFAGNIHGEYVELEPGKIVQKWRFKDWPVGWYSTVTILLEATNASTCKVTLTQTDIPDCDKFGNHSQKENVENGWNSFFWERIQKMLGYHKVPKADW